VSTGFCFRKEKERVLRLEPSRTENKQIQATQTDSIILYDATAMIAWMVPKIFAVMHLLQAWTKNRHPSIKITYPTLPIDDLYQTLEVFWSQKTPVVKVNLKENFMWFAESLDRLRDESELMPAKDLLQPKRLAGVDFAHDCGGYKLLKDASIISLKSHGLLAMSIPCSFVVVSTQREDSPRTYVHIESNLHHFREGGFMIYQPSTDLNLINIRLWPAARGQIE
jgi:hypothetical protein